MNAAGRFVFPSTFQGSTFVRRPDDRAAMRCWEAVVVGVGSVSWISSAAAFALVHPNHPNYLNCFNNLNHCSSQHASHDHHSADVQHNRGRKRRLGSLLVQRRGDSDGGNESTARGRDRNSRRTQTGTSSSGKTRAANIAVLGGGASGIFASIAAAEPAASSNVRVTVLEATGKTLSKVKISGGGRCNVMHDTTKTTPTILSGYPRGNKELTGLFHKRFTPTMARDWFEYRGVELKTEADGRMFPVTDDSQTVIDALIDSAYDAGVKIRTRQKVESVELISDDHRSSSDSESSTSASTRFRITHKDGTNEDYDSVILATGSALGGYDLAKQLGHDIVTPVPSLFTLNCKLDIKEGGLLHDLQGLSVPNARVSLSNRQYQEGPLLITHHGVSGPAVLRLSAFAAREFKEINYRSHIKINWDVGVFGTNVERIVDILNRVGPAKPKRKLVSGCPIRDNSIPRRLWASLCRASGFTDDDVWGNARKKNIRSLATNLVACSVETTGKGTFKEEFVTAGGVDLKQVEMRTMASKLCPGLFFCGEVINVDGVTGGYNFLNCWGTGFVAGTSAAAYIAGQRSPPSLPDDSKRIPSAEV